MMAWFDWLFEGRTAVYVILAALIAFLFAVWRQTRKRGLLIGIATVAVLVGLYALLDRAVETDREQVVRKVHALAEAVNRHDLDALFVNISDQFRSPKGLNKAELRGEARNYLERGIVERVKIWDVACPESPSRDQGQVHVFFRAKAQGVHDMLTDCDTVFDYDAQHGWRLRSIHLLKPQTTEEWPNQL